LINSKNEMKNLISKMTLEEKIAQMYQLYGGVYDFPEEEGSIPVTGPAEEWEFEEQLLFKIGSVLNVNRAQKARKIQKKYLENNRHEIPLMFMYDIIHGYKTIFPIPLGSACSWDMELIEESARVAAREGSVSGINVTFSPMADLVRDARWGRVMESPGEDPLINEKMAAALVKGYQGTDLKKDDTVAACVKHFAAYGAVEAGREYNTVDLSDYRLNNYYLSGYKAGIDAGARMIMTAFNTLNGVPATGNQYLIQDILREKWDFFGPVISDYGSVSELIAHGYAKNGKEAAQKAVQAGVDIEMVTPEYIKHLADLVTEEVIAEKKIDTAVERILNLKYDLGLFSDPFRYINESGEEKYHLCSTHRKKARQLAAESMVLLENDGVLPLKENLEEVTLLGPFADSGKMLGNWSGEGDADDTVTAKEGLVNELPDETELNVYSQIENISQGKFLDIIETVKKSAATILAVGEPQSWSGEARSRTRLTLPEPQEKFIKKLVNVLKEEEEELNLVLVLFNGRPLELEWYSENIPAILEAWYPGTEGGHAVADILLGQVNPSGKLTISFPYSVGQMPLYYNRYSTGRPPMDQEVEKKNCSRYLDVPNHALYPFGYGLSYTEFEYHNINLEKNKITAGETNQLNFALKNSGQYKGQEVVQLYIKDCYANRVRPILELKGYQKISLAPGEKKNISFEITEEMLIYFDENGQNVIEPGAFEIYLGSSSKDLRECGILEYQI